MRRHAITTVLGLTSACLTTVCLITACGSGGDSDNPRPTAPGNVPSGFKQIGGALNGVLISVPTSWTAVDLAKDDIEKGLENSGLTGSALEQAKGSLRALAANKAVYAMDPESAKESSNQFSTNLNGFCQASVGASAQALIDVAKSQLESVHAKVSEAAEVPLNGAKGVRIKYSLPMKQAKVQGTQFYVPSGNGKTCIVTLSTDLPGKNPLFDQIGGTIRPI
ncbi:hypothetical protein [Planotetraspora sp. GP83]|uniref:hypothetical protein n=1 Tax=Planotetraspora sp. GP83 TaxID=3156264 RepID=UPI003514B9DC